MADKTKVDAYFDDNPLLVSIENSKPYKETLKMIRQALEKQWDDVISSDLINDLYRDFPAIQTSGKTRSITKAEGDIAVEERNTKPLRETLDAQTGLSTAEEAIIVAAILAYLVSRVQRQLKSIAEYSSFADRMTGYLKHVSDKAGQTIIDLANIKPKVEFRLSKELYKEKIAARVETLISNMDTTTKERLVNNIAKAVEEKLTRTEMIKELRKLGKDFSENRAKVIIHNETQAVSEFMRHETARLNGVKVKTWKTVGDEKVTDICRSLDGQKVPIDKDFKGIKFQGPFPPAHINCRSWIVYELNQDAWKEFSKSLSQDSPDLVQKEYEQYEYTGTDEEPLPIFNPNAVWAGGENLVGADKSIGAFYQRIKAQFEWKSKAKDALRPKDGVMWIEQEGYFPRNEVENAIQEARVTLTDIGFIQLVLALGFRRKIYSKKT